jgi:hypothetical protein
MRALIERLGAEARKRGDSGSCLVSISPPEAKEQTVRILVMRGALVGNGRGAGGVEQIALACALAFEADDLIAELEDDLVLLADVVLEMGVVFLQPG